MLHPSPNAKIHVGVNSVSPTKKSQSCSFFDGEITDGKVCMHVLGFDASVHKKLVEFYASKSAVALANCELKSSRKGKVLEVLLTLWLPRAPNGALKMPGLISHVVPRSTQQPQRSYPVYFAHVLTSVLIYIL